MEAGGGDFASPSSHRHGASRATRMSTSNDSPADPETDPVLIRSSLAFPVVGIGASAGGLGAVGRLLENMPSESGMAFVVVLHLVPDHESMASAIFQRSTRMPVVEVRKEVPIEPGTVYVVPPGHSLSMNDGHLRLKRIERRFAQQLAIDLFFRSLAEVHRERAIAIVLTGAGSDGAQGLRRVKERGGVALVQSPADAEYESMPLNAIATGAADFVLPVGDMAQKLVELWSNAKLIELPHPLPDRVVEASPTSESEQEAEEALKAVMQLLRESTGHDFSHYKRATVLRRIERRMQVSRRPTLPSYAAYLHENPKECVQLLQDMLISVTNFFRDRPAFEALERALSAKLSDGADRPAVDRMRAWVTGCATGEEAYSVAMLLLEHANDAQRLDGVHVFATDIDERALAVGRVGIYPESIVTDVPPVRLRQFFNREPGQYHVTRALRERVTFSSHNLLRDPPFSRLDLICCRNLLIYLDRAAQRQLLETFHFALRPGGLLFLGSAETADAAPEQFTVVDRKHRIYRASTTVPPRQVSPALAKTLGYLPPLVPAGVSSRRQVLDDIRRQLIDENAPPAAVVDPQLKVAYLSEKANRYLQLNSGELSAQLLQLVWPELRLTLRAALAQARQTGETVQARRVRLVHDGNAVVVDMTVRPVWPTGNAEAAQGWLVVLFDEAAVAPAASAEAKSVEDVQASEQTRSDLHDLHDQLATAVEQSSQSEEALRAANEELQSLNEELRSTREELETSKEELQSVNEELVTVNHDLKLHLEATAKANDDLQNFIAASDIATVFVDRALRIQRYTPSAAAIFNLLAADVGRPLLDIAHRLDYPQMQADARETFDSLRPLERTVTSADGRWFLVRVLPYRSSADRIEGAVLNFIDVTGRHRAEDELRAGQERLRLLLDSSADYVILMLDPQGRVTSWSKGAERALGYTEAEVQGHVGDFIFTPEDRASKIPEEELRRAREDGRAEDERWHLRKDGSRVYFSGMMVSLGREAEHGYAKIARDLTQARLAEQQRDELLVSEQLLRTELQAASVLKDEFLAVMSHELKNPLNLIALNADLLSRQPEARASAALARIADTITTAVRSQGQLIDDLLDLSRLQTGKLTLRLEEVGVDELVRRIVDALRPDAQARGVALRLRIEGDDHRLRADPVRIEQIVWNLLSNALKFTPNGGAIEVSLAADEAALRFEVVDSGSGITPEFLPLVFEMFQQSDARPTTRGKGGLGIGLAIVKRLAEAHGGHASATSPGRGLGATFTVVLPRPPAPGVPSRADVVAAGRLQGVRILLIDDERDMLEVFGMILEGEGAAVTTAASADEALAQAAPHRFDLVVSDIGLPGMDGYELLYRLREAGVRGVPALALTGFTRPHDRERARAAGFDEHLGKPIDVEVLMSAIGRLLASRPA